MKLFTIPNLLTLGNLFCGILSCIFILYDFVPFYFLIVTFSLSLIFDFLDGLVARLLKQNFEIGIQLDSMADMVSFGLVPGLAAYSLLFTVNPLTYNNTFVGNFFPNKYVEFNLPETYTYLNAIAFIIVLFSALRLAKFNLDKEQTLYFKGLATPANAIFFVSLYICRNHLFEQGKILKPFGFEYPLLIFLCILFSILLISNIPMFSFKLKGFGWQKNHFKYVFLIISILLLILFQMNSIPFIIILYIITSIIFRKKIINA